MSNRRKSIMMVFGLSHQLKNWIDHARSLGHMTQKFKHDSGNLSMQLDRFMKNYGADDDLLFENSVQVSDVFERIAQLDEQDIRRVLKLMDKIESEKQYPKISHD